MRKKIKLSIRIKNCDTVFKKSLGPGVIGTREIIYKISEEDYKSNLFTLEIMEKGEELVNELIEIIPEEIE